MNDCRITFDDGLSCHIHIVPYLRTVKVLLEKSSAHGHNMEILVTVKDSASMISPTSVVWNNQSVNTSRVGDNRPKEYPKLKLDPSLEYICRHPVALL